MNMESKVDNLSKILPELVRKVHQRREADVERCYAEMDRLDEEMEVIGEKMQTLMEKTKTMDEKSSSSLLGKLLKQEESLLDETFVILDSLKCGRVVKGGSTFVAESLYYAFWHI